MCILIRQVLGVVRGMVVMVMVGGAGAGARAVGMVLIGVGGDVLWIGNEVMLWRNRTGRGGLKTVLWREDSAGRRRG